MNQEGRGCVDLSGGWPEGIEIDERLVQAQSDCPVARAKLPFGGEGWVVTRYDDVRRVTSGGEFTRVQPGLSAPRVSTIRAGGGTLGSLEGTEHKRLRSFVSGAFSTRRIEKLRASARSYVSASLDEMERSGAGADIMPLVAEPLPMAIICDILGASMGDRGEVQRWARALVSSDGVSAKQIRAADEEIRAYIRGLIDERRTAVGGSDPFDDTLADLVRTQDTAGGLSDDEIVLIGVSLLVGGYTTTVNQIGNAVATLLNAPGVWSALVDEQQLVAQTVEEVLRYVQLSGGVGRSRFAVQDMVLRGVKISRGDAVFVAPGVANRDPRVFDNPDQFSMRRERNPHLTFGHGAHRCLGAALARMEMQEVLHGLVERFPELRLDGGWEGILWNRGLLMRGPESLRVAW